MAVNWKRSRKQPKINNVAKFQGMSVEKKKIVCAKEEYNSAQMNTQ
jgi:hypothetical protein